MNRAQYLLKVYDLIEDPDHFTTGSFAKDAKGRDVSYAADTAVAFCLLGAMTLVAERNNLHPALKLDTYALLRAEVDRVSVCFMPPAQIAWYSDNHTHEQVLQVLRRVIAKELL